MKNLINKLSLTECSDEAGRPYFQMKAIDKPDELVVVGDETGVFEILLNGLRADLSSLELDQLIKNYERIVKKNIVDGQILLSLY